MLAETVLHLERVRQAERGRRDRGIEKRGSSFEPVRHETPIELQQEIIRQPFGEVRGLRRGKARGTAGESGGFGRP